MSVASTDTARNEIYAVLETAWLANPTSAPIPRIWEGVTSDSNNQDGDLQRHQGYIRSRVQHSTGGQSTLSNVNNRRTFENTGFITVQVFTKVGNNLSLNGNLVDIVKTAYETTQATPSNIWFRNVRSNEIGTTGIWYQTNVIADFVYDQIK